LLSESEVQTTGSDQPSSRPSESSGKQSELQSANRDELSTSSNTYSTSSDQPSSRPSDNSNQSSSGLQSANRDELSTSSNTYSTSSDQPSSRPSESSGKQSGDPADNSERKATNDSNREVTNDLPERDPGAKPSQGDPYYEITKNVPDYHESIIQDKSGNLHTVNTQLKDQTIIETIGGKKEATFVSMEEEKVIIDSHKAQASDINRPGQASDINRPGETALEFGSHTNMTDIFHTNDDSSKFSDHVGTKIADSIDKTISDLQQRLIGEPKNSALWIVGSTLIEVQGTLLKGMTDILRLGKGLDDARAALNDKNKDIIEKVYSTVKGVGEDILRASSLVAPLAGTLEKAAAGGLEKAIVGQVEKAAASQVEKAAASQVEKAAASQVEKAAASQVEKTSKFLHDEFAQKVLGQRAQEKVFSTPWSADRGLGTRKLDHWIKESGTGFEFNTTPWSKMTQEQLSRKLDQVGSDYALLRTNPEVNKIIWVGTEPFPRSGLGAQLEKALKDAGISYWVVKP
jgi:hypothetical protein